jgi:hypothetical protein
MIFGGLHRREFPRHLGYGLLRISWHLPTARGE